MKILDPVLHRSRKEAILEKARHLFANKGFAETSMDDIAHEMTIQKASLYHYFKSKQEILEEMILLEGDRWMEEMKGDEQGTLSENLTRFGLAFLKSMDELRRKEFFKIIHFESHKNPIIFKAFKESPTYKKSLIYEVFDRHLKQRFSRCQIAMLVTQFMGGLIHYINLSRMRGENMCLEKFSDGTYVRRQCGGDRRHHQAVIGLLF